MSFVINHNDDKNATILGHIYHDHHYCKTVSTTPNHLGHRVKKERRHSDIYPILTHQAFSICSPYCLIVLSTYIPEYPSDNIRWHAVCPCVCVCMCVCACAYEKRCTCNTPFFSHLFIYLFIS